jgi:hypothetical protein
MMQNIVKELKFGLRGSKFVILAAGFFFFALLNPVMIKFVLPAILQSQFPGMSADALSGMFEASQTASVQSYMGDVFEIGTIIVVFTLCGVIAQELKEKTLVLPVCSGKSFGGIVSAKLAVFGPALVIILLAALIADWAYSGVLMGFEVPLMPVVWGGLLQGMYMVFILSCLMMFGSLLARPIASGVLTLIAAYGSHYIGGAFGIGEYMPSGLLGAAASLSNETAEVLPALLITAGASALLCVLSLSRLKRIELGIGGAK